MASRRREKEREKGRKSKEKKWQSKVDDVGVLWLEGRNARVIIALAQAPRPRRGRATAADRGLKLRKLTRPRT